MTSIGKQIVFIENRNGNSNVKFKQSETLQAAYEMLERKNIRIDRSLMDCGSFTKEIIKLLRSTVKGFAIAPLPTVDFTGFLNFGFSNGSFTVGNGVSPFKFQV